MSCFDGHMQEYSRVSLDRFDGRNLQSTVYFLSHLHEDHTKGLNGDLFLKRLKSNKDIFLYCSDVTKVLIEASPKYRQLSPYVKCLDINTPTTITVPDPLYEEREQITVTLLPAFHCPGSVMFLVEGNEGTVLYTGDFRWEHFDIEHMHELRSADSVKKIKSLYVDTTFCRPDNLHIPSRQQCIDAVCQIVQEWTSQSPHHVVYILLRAYYGHEPLMNSVASRLNKKVHVSKHKYDVYERIVEFSGNFTYDGASTQLHACDSKCTVDVDGETILCKDAHDADKVLYILPTTMYFTQFQQLSLEKIVKRIKSNFYRACYSFHSSYTEVKDLLAYLKPERVHANVKCPKDKTLEETQHRLNVMLRECVEHGAGDATPVEMEVKELGTLKTKPGYKTRKRKGRESPSDSESLDFGSPLKKTPSVDLELLTPDGSRARKRGKGRGKRTQESVEQSVVITRRSSRLSAASSVEEGQVTPKKRKTSRRSETPDLFITPEKNKNDDDNDVQSSFLGSQRSDSELSLFSSQKSHEGSLLRETDWTGGSFLAAVSSNEDYDGMFCVTEDNQELDESSVVIIEDEEDVEGVESHIADSAVDSYQDVPESDKTDSHGDSEKETHYIIDSPEIEKTSVGIDENLPENVESDMNKEIEANNDIEDVLEQSNELHLHFSGSSLNGSIKKDSDGTSERNDEIVILDSDSNEPRILDDSDELISSSDNKEKTRRVSDTDGKKLELIEEDVECVALDEEKNPIIVNDDDTSLGSLTQYDKGTTVVKQNTINDPVEDDSIPDSAKGNANEQQNDSSKAIKHDFVINIEQDDTNNQETSAVDDQHNFGVANNIENDSNAFIMDVDNNDKSTDVDDKTSNEDEDDVVEIVDLTGDDLGAQYETQETPKVGKKLIKISLLSKNVGKKLKKLDGKLKEESNEFKAAVCELIEEKDSKAGRDNNDTILSEEVHCVEENASNDEVEEIGSSPEWLSVSKATAQKCEIPVKKTSNDSAVVSDMNKKTDSLETVNVSKEDMEMRAEVKRQAMGFVCETDSESDSDESSSPDSPTADVLYDDYIELSSDSDKEGDASEFRPGRNRDTDKSTDNSKTNSGGDGSNASSSGWLRSQKGGGHSDQVDDHETISERAENRESNQSQEKSDQLEDVNVSYIKVVNNHSESMSDSGFQRRKHLERKNHYRNNQVTENNLQSGTYETTPVQSFGPTFYPPRSGGSQPPSGNDNRQKEHSTSQHHPSVPNVSEESSISFPLMVPRTSKTESYGSQFPRPRSPKVSVKKKQIAPWQQERAKLFHRGPSGQLNEYMNTTQSRSSSEILKPMEYRKGKRDETHVKTTVGESFAAINKQQDIKLTGKVDMASIKSNIAALTGISVVSEQLSSSSSVVVGNKSGESLDEMVDKLKKLEQMKALLNVVSGTTTENPAEMNTQLGAGETKEVYDYAHRNTRQFNEMNEDGYQSREENYSETRKKHMDSKYVPERFRYDEEYSRRRNMSEGEDYEQWLEEKRRGDYYRTRDRRPLSPPRVYHEDPYYDMPPPHHHRYPDYDRPIPPRHRDGEYDRPPQFREPEYGRLPHWHRDLEYGRPHPPCGGDLEYERLRPHHRDLEYGRPPPPRRGDPEYERLPPRHRDLAYEERIERMDRDYYKPASHRPENYPPHCPPPSQLGSQHDRRERLEPQFDRKPELYHNTWSNPTIERHNHGTDLYNNDPYTKISEYDDMQSGGNVHGHYHEDRHDISGPNTGSHTLADSGLVGNSYLRLQAQRKEFKKKPIIARVLSRSGQVLSVAHADVSLQQSQVIKPVEDHTQGDIRKADISMPVFQTGLIPNNR